MEEEKKQNDSEPATLSDERMDTAGKSLADALRLSFRLLSFFMIGVVAAFFFTGLSCIQTNERGIKLLFGRVRGQGDDRVLDEGLTWSFPEPIGRIEKIPTGARSLAIDDFWFHVKPEDALKKVSQLRAPSEGLRPGWDGALLTGDRGLIHMRFTCTYRIGFKDNKPDAAAVIDYKSNIIDHKEIVRSAVCNAAIRVAATLTVNSILTTAQDKLGKAIKKLGQDRLDKMHSGIQIVSIDIKVPKPPLAAIAAFDAVGSARQDEDTLKNKALGEANSILAQAAGDSWKDLVEDPAGADAGPKPLLKQYALARENGDETAAGKLLEKINRLLVSNKTKGEAREIIENANRYNDSIRRRIESRAQTFSRLIDKFEATPILMTERLWAETKEKVFKSPTVQTHILTPGKKTVIRVSEDPEVKRRRARERLKARPGEQKSGKR